MKYKIYSLFITLVFLVFSGCSGIGGTGGTVEEEDVLPVLKKSITGLISQKRSAKGEIVVSGTTYKLSESVVKRSGVVVDYSSLLVGQRVVISATDLDEDGVFDAKEIKVDESLVGPIFRIDVAKNRLVVLGVDVIISEKTRFVGRDLNDFKVDNGVAVFGVISRDGSIEASLVEFIKEDFDRAKDQVVFEGRIDVSAISDDTMASNSFVESSVDGSTATSADFDVRVADVGQVVKIENVDLEELFDRLNHYRPTGMDISSTKNLHKSSIVVEGYIFNHKANAYFDIANTHVSLLYYAGAVVFKDGDYAIVNGVYDESGSVQLKSIEIIQPDHVVVSGEVTALLLETREIQVLGNTFLLQNSSVIVIEEDELVVGAKVIIGAYKNENGQFIVNFIKDSDTKNSFVNGSFEKLEDEFIFVSGLSYAYHTETVFKLNGVTSNDALGWLKLGVDVRLTVVLVDDVLTVSEVDILVIKNEDNGIEVISNERTRGF